MIVKKILPYKASRNKTYLRQNRPVCWASLIVSNRLPEQRLAGTPAVPVGRRTTITRPTSPTPHGIYPDLYACGVLYRLYESDIFTP
jgi:hypothetical protein